MKKGKNKYIYLPYEHKYKLYIGMGNAKLFHIPLFSVLAKGKGNRIVNLLFSSFILYT